MYLQVMVPQHQSPQHHYQQQQQHHQHQQQQQRRQQEQHHQQLNPNSSDSSLEATWQDLVTLLDLPSASNRSGAGNDSSSMGTNGAGLTPNTSGVLLHNASMPTPAPLSGNVTFNTSGNDLGYISQVMTMRLW